MTNRILTSSQLTIDLSNLRANYRLVLDRLDGVPAAAMVKANGYGLGAVEVGTALWEEGCSQFFVAQLSEGLELRDALPTAPISVLNGPMPGTETDLHRHRLTPVLNSLQQINGWKALASELGQTLAATLHLDTGMSRLGLAADETAALVHDPSLLDGLAITHIMSHLASADVANSQQPADQLHQFTQLRRLLPQGTASLANSAGIFLDSAFHFDLARPGIALYGGTPLTDGTNPMLHVATLEAPIIQVRTVLKGDAIGYGATHLMERAGKVATISVGYGDGFLRSGSGVGEVHFDGHDVRVIGRISMDLITLDVSDVPENQLYLGAPVELIGEHRPIDDVAARAGSIANELLTNLGRRYRRSYIG